MLFCYAGVHETIGELLSEPVQTRPPLHGGRDGDDAIVAASFLHKRLAEHARIRRSGSGLLLHFARGNVERRDAVELLGVANRGLVARALARDHVDERQTVGGEHRGQRFLEQPDVVPVDGSGAQDAQLLEHHRTRDDELLHGLFHVAAELSQGVAERAAAFQHLLHAVARLTILRGRTHVPQVFHERAHVARNGHLVVVQDDDQGRLRLPNVVERLEGHAAGKRRIADDRHDLLGSARQIARLGQAQRYGKRVGSMTGRMHVVRAFTRLREAGQAPRTYAGCRTPQADPSPICAHTPDAPRRKPACHEGSPTCCAPPK